MDRLPVILGTFCLALTPAVARGEEPRPATLGEVLILFKGSSELGFYQPDGRLITKVPVGKHPHEMVLSPDGRYAYISDNGTMRIEDKGAGANTVSIVDVKERKKVGEIDLGEFRRPHGIDIDPRTGMVLVTTEAPDQLLVLDPVKRVITRKYDTKGRTSHMVTLGRDGRYAYVSNAGSGTVAAIELDSGKVTLIPTGERPQGSVLSGDGKRLYVANRESYAVAVIDTDSHTVIGQIRTSNGPSRIDRTPDDRFLVIALLHDRAVEFADPQTLKVVGRIALKGSAVSMSVSPDGSRAYAGVQDLCRVCVISIPERTIVTEIATPDGAFPDPARELRPKGTSER
jgi:YVTN family beta-propeller protein